VSSRGCVVCGGLYGGSRVPGLLECRSCGFSTADLEISAEELESLYTAEYFAGQEYKDYVAEQALMEKQFRVRLATLLRYVPDPASKRLFEIGSAYGFFLSVARSKFLSVEGIDISRDAATYARERLGLPVHIGDFLDFDLEHNVDVVCLWDTIEHLKNPDLYIEKVAGHMNRGGVIAITTGDIGSLVARLRGSKWRQIHPPTHLHYFSKVTLTRLLEKYGFTVVSCGHEGVYRSMDTIAYIILNLKHDLPGAYAALKKSRLLDWSLYLNLYDILFLVATRN
jgi:2-polyprenyl-3-methyl-5-hydroxy-6-metoxy-1,4-benzoquinol methylase